MTQNIYEPPKSELISPGVVSLKQKILCTLFAVVAAFIFRGIYVVAPQFSETFIAFGGELPLLTRTAIYVGPGFLWVAIISLFPCLIWLSGFVNHSFSLLIFKTSKWIFALAVLIFLLFIIAMYLPIFTL